MNEPLTPQNPPGVPPPPPKLNQRNLWISLLAPPGAMLFATIILVFLINMLTGSASAETTFQAACWVICLLTAGAWGLYIHTLAQRFRGWSLGLLILAYPILQSIVLFSIFFVGCLTTFWMDGYF